MKAVRIILRFSEAITSVIPASPDGYGLPRPQAGTNQGGENHSNHIIRQIIVQTKARWLPGFFFLISEDNNYPKFGIDNYGFILESVRHKLQACASGGNVCRASGWFGLQILWIIASICPAEHVEELGLCELVPDIISAYLQTSDVSKTSDD